MKQYVEPMSLRVRLHCFPNWRYFNTWFFLAAIAGAPLAHAGSLQWNSEVIDDLGTVGWYSTVALDSTGRPHVAYYDYSSEAVKYASWDGAMWSIETVTSAGRRQGGSLAIDSSDVPHISVRDYDNGKLMYATKTGASWTVEDVATIGAPASARTFIAVDKNGNPGIVAHGAAGVNLGLHYSRKIGGSWQTTLVANNGSDAALAYDADRNPHISFHDSGTLDLKYATLDGGIWDVQIVDDDGWTGWYTSVALDRNGVPHISYLDRANLDLKYAYWNEISWDIQTVDSQNETGFYSSLAFDPKGAPSIAYYDRIANSLGDLRYASWDGSSWIIQIVDSEGDVGRYSSLAMDDHGFAHISYYDMSNQDLKYAMGVPEVPEPATSALAVTGVVAVLWFGRRKRRPLSGAGNSETERVSDTRVKLRARPWSSATRNLCLILIVACASDVAADDSLDQKAIEREQAKLTKRVERLVKRGKGDFYVVALLETQFHRWVTRKYQDIDAATGFRVNVTETKTAGLHPVPQLQILVVDDPQAAVNVVVQFMAPLIKIPSTRSELRKLLRSSNPPGIPTRQWRVLGRFRSRAQAENTKTASLAKFHNEPHWVLARPPTVEQWYPNSNAIPKEPAAEKEDNRAAPRGRMRGRDGGF